MSDLSDTPAGYASVRRGVYGFAGFWGYHAAQAVCLTGHPTATHFSACICRQGVGLQVYSSRHSLANQPLATASALEKWVPGGAWVRAGAKQRSKETRPAGIVPACSLRARGGCSPCSPCGLRVAPLPAFGRPCTPLRALACRLAGRLRGTVFCSLTKEHGFRGLALRVSGSIPGRSV